MWQNEVLGTFLGSKYFDSGKIKWDDDPPDESLPKLDDLLKEEEKNVEIEEKEDIKEVVNTDNSAEIKNEPKDESYLSLAPLTARKNCSPIIRNSKLRPVTSYSTAHDIFAQKVKESEIAFQHFMEEIQSNQNALNSRIMTRMSILVDRQKEELRNHDFDWKYGNHAKMYQRESPNLREMRLQHERMKKLGMDEDAKEIYKIYEREKRNEEKENKEAKEKAFLESRAKLEMKHKRERNIAIQCANEKKTVFAAKQNQNTQIYVRRQAILKNTMRKNTPTKVKLCL